jgi:tRNA(Ile)-lysidine synthase
LFVQRVDGRHASGQSPEDAARQARYQAFDAALASEPALAAIKTVALAQHADDQVETMLLALSRGAGVAGIAAMPAHWQRQGRVWCRPLLHVSSHDVRDWLRQGGHAWIEDPSNDDTQFSRNYLRHQVLPALTRRWPQASRSLARSAAHLAEAQGGGQQRAILGILLAAGKSKLSGMMAQPEWSPDQNKIGIGEIDRWCQQNKHCRRAATVVGDN